MRKTTLCLLLICGIGIFAAETTPKVSGVEPANAKPGAVVTVNGESLAKPNVEKVYLTDGKNDTIMPIVEQADKAIKCKVPDSMKPGRFSVMLLTGGLAPRLIEQPVKMTIE
ncbi:MAG: IPT/TIG domain-containing protein [Bryobacteraceae bacterium]